MASLVTRTAHTVSRSCSSAVAEIWRSVGGPSSSSVLQCRSYSDEGLDSRVPPSPEASSAADPLVDTPLSGEFPPAVPKIETFGAYRPVNGRNSYPARSSAGFRVCQTVNAVLGLDRRVPPRPEASSAAHPLVATPLSGEFPPAVAKTQTFGADRPIHDRNARNWEGFRVEVPVAFLKPQRTRTAFNDEESPVGNCLRASSIVAQESCRDSSRQGFVPGKELPIGSACGGGNIHVSKAVAMLKHRQEQGIVIDSYTFVQVLTLCSKQKDLVATRRVNECIIQSGMGNNPYVTNTLLNAYVRCGRLQDARRVFDRLDKKTAFTWSIMIAGYAKNDHAEDALEIFNQMRQAGTQPGELLCLSILNACSSPLALKRGKEVHAYIRHAGLESDVRVGTALVQMYAKCGCITEARRIFEKLTNRDVITWNAMIGAYTKSGFGVEAYRLFLQMQRESFKPNAITYLSILNASASEGSLEWVKEVHRHALQAELESDLRVGNALVHMYAKCGSIDDARLIFGRMEERDVMTWTIMIGAYAESGFGVEAYRLFCQMKREGFLPNAFTYVSILNASASAGALEWVKAVHSDALKAGLESDLRVGNALVHMYAKSGSIDDARLIFNRMEKRDVVAWNTMIGGLAQHGCGHEALELFRRMNADGVKPNGTSFVAVLSACCHAGFVDDGRRILLAMTQDYGIEPTVVHWNCMVDLLGRAGHLEEAKLVIDYMPVEPDGVTWTALLGACRTYGNVELGELAAKQVLKLEPKDAAAYVLLSNIYAAAGKWEKVRSVRTMMQKRGVWKEPGRSWIEVDNKIHEFVVGDTSHPEAKAVYTVLKELTEKLKAEGYIPDTKLVLQDIHEEEKELALCSHSEKLAIAYGLLRIPRGQPIRVYKNLRVCSDCHTATKFISKVTGREIIARDANRFHHFKDGVCSCGDYW